LLNGEQLTQKWKSKDPQTITGHETMGMVHRIMELQ